MSATLRTIAVLPVKRFASAKQRLAEDFSAGTRRAIVEAMVTDVLVGLRRAKGATIADVRRQVLVEMVIMTSLALIVGVALLGQLPLLPLPNDLRIVAAPVFVGSLVFSVAAIYLLTLACGWYPSRLATKIEPAEALHYE